MELGSKVNKIQIDGLSFIEHISFYASNEEIRLISGIYKVQNLPPQKRLIVMGADAIYATNKNRNYVAKHQIKKDFKPKGWKPKTTKKSKR